MCVYILSHADVKYLFYQLHLDPAARSAAAVKPCFSEQKRGLPMGNGSSPQVLAVPAVVRVWVDGQKMLNLQWEMGVGRWEITDPAARSQMQVQDSAGWYLEVGRSQRDMGNWQTGRGLMAHGSWPMSTGTVLKLSPRGPFAR